MSKSPLLQTQFAVATIDAIRSRIDDLPLNTRLTVETLCGNSFWQSISSDDHKLAGKIVRQAVKECVLPLWYAGHTTANMALYEIVLPNASSLGIEM